MDTRLLEYLIILEEEGSLAHAAERIHISQSALSQNLNKLEQKLQTPLFVRSDKKWIPTAAGRCYLEGAKEMIQVRDETYRQLRQLFQASSTCIRLSLCSQIYYLYSGLIVNEFKELFPDLQLELHRSNPGTALEYLINNSVDVAIVHTVNTSYSQLTFRQLYHEKFVLAVPNEMAWEGSEINWELLSHCPFIIPSKSSPARDIINHVLQEKHLLFPEYYEASSSIETLQLIERGYGAALVPERTIIHSTTCRSYQWSSFPEYDVIFAYLQNHPNASTLNHFYEHLISLIK